MKKQFIYSAIAALVISPMFTQEKAHGIELEYDNLTETQSFYRVTRGFVSPLAELDNNLETKVQFTKGRYLSYMDYIFLKDISVKEIRFASDTPQYQRIVLMRGSTIQQQFDLAKFPDGVITLTNELAIDQVKLQFNGVEGTQHFLSELEIVGRVLTTDGGTAPSGDVTLVTPDIIKELIPEDESGPIVGGGEPTDPTQPPIEEDDEGTTPGTGGDPVIPDAPVIDEDNGDSEATPGEGTPLDPPVIDEDEGTPGDGTGTGTDLGEEEEGDREPVEGDTDYVDNGDAEEENPTNPEDGGVVVPGQPEEDDAESDIPVEIPAFDPVKEFAGVKAMPLTPSVFSNKHVYGLYKVNAASLMLMDHKHYDEAFLRDKLDGAYILVDGEYLKIGEFIELLKAQDKKNGKDNGKSNKKK